MEDEEETEDDEDGEREGKKNNGVRYLYSCLNYETFSFLQMCW